MIFLFYIDITLCIQFVIVSVILFFLNKGNKTANKFLGLFFTILALTNISLSLYFIENPIFPHLLKVHVPLQYSIAPLLYLYIKALFEKEFKFKYSFLLHFSLSLLFFIKEFSFFFQSADQKLLWNANRGETYHYYLAALFYLQFIVYIGFILKKLIKYNKQLHDGDEYSISIKKWIKEIIVMVFMLLAVNIIPVFISPKSMIAIPILCSVLYILILYKVFFDPNIFVYLQACDQIIHDRLINPQSDISKEMGIDLSEKLQKCINEKVYIDSNITLPALAERISVPYHQLSRFINEQYNQNFNDFINFNRIEEVKKRLLDTNYNHLTIEAIGKSVGFNSKTAFYTAFKKHANCSPNQFRKANLTKNI